MPVLDELTAIQADAIRATAAAHDRDPEELALELMHLLITEETAEAINAPPATPALTADQDDTEVFSTDWRLTPPYGTEAAARRRGRCVAA